MIIWNNHGCMPLRPDDTSFLPKLEDVRAAGVDILSLNVGFGPTGPDEHLAMLRSFTDWLDCRTDDYLIVRSSSDVAAARASGKLGIIFDVEGMAPLNNGRIDLVETFRAAAVGWMLIAYNRANDAGSGCYDEVDTGLTQYGRDVIDEMRRVGMILCCSHTGRRTAIEAIEHAGMPVIFSHSNVRALDDHARNIPDELIDACAASGGVVGINGLGVFLGGNATPERVADHVEYVATRVGDDHVGLALDYVFDRNELEEYLAKMRHTFPDDDPTDALAMLDDSHIALVAHELKRRGFGTDSLAKILGGNWQRVAAQVWH
ncbi:dipeptidase [Sphingomonas sp. RB1R13]|uniref:dipeptidase n=1 Tax=Sphingomonas sp. RB1R13 TaxID=3096159 RepID=UPI002FCCB3CF